MIKLKEEMFHPPKPKIPSIRILLTFLVKTEDLQLLKVVCELWEMFS